LASLQLGVGTRIYVNLAGILGDGGADPEGFIGQGLGMG